MKRNTRWYLAPAAAAERYQRVFRFMTAPPHIFRWSHL